MLRLGASWTSMYCVTESAGDGVRFKLWLDGDDYVNVM